MVSGTSLFVFYALGLLWQLASAMFNAPAGPFEIQVKQLENCPDEGTGQVHFGSKINSAGNGKYTYNSSFSFQVPLDDHMKLYAKVQQWGNGGYKPRYIEYTTKNCKDLWAYAKDTITGLMRAAGVTVTDCPIPKGNYTANNWEVDLKINLPAMKYNKYKTIVTFYYKEVKVGCEIIYADVVPKSFG